MATWNLDVMAAQNGTEIVTSDSTNEIDITEHDIITPVSNVYKTEYKAIGVTGSEIGYVYLVNEDGTYGKQFTQATSAASGQFVYSPTDKTITFTAGDSVTGKIACSYTRKAADGAKRLSIEADKIPDTVLVTAYGIAKDACNGELYPCQVEGMAQVDGNYNFDLASDGEPAVHSLNMEFVKPCGSKKLYDFTVYTEEESK